MTDTARLLIVEPAVQARSALVALFEQENYLVETIASGLAVLPKLDEFSPDLVVLDLKGPELADLRLLRQILANDPTVSVIVLSELDAVDTAVAAMRAGAADHVAKPIHLDELLLRVALALDRRRLQKEAQALRVRLTEPRQISSLVGASPAMQAVLDAVLLVGPLNAPVLISGERGTGKTLVAAAIHEQSQCARDSLLKVHCSELSEAQLEGRLFGPEGVLSLRTGRGAQVCSGNLFLDGIGELSPTVQGKLLHYLREQELAQASGSPAEAVRIIAATHRDLREWTVSGAFIEDLYNRLSAIHLELPPLRKHPSDIGPLAQHFLRLYAKQHVKSIRGFTEDALGKLLRYSWPGNVRQLESAIERAVVLCRVDILQAEDFVLPELSIGDAGLANAGYPPVPGSSLAALERFAIEKTMESTAGDAARAAQILAVSPRELQAKRWEYQARLRTDAAANPKKQTAVPARFSAALYRDTSAIPTDESRRGLAPVRTK